MSTQPLSLLVFLMGWSLWNGAAWAQDSTANPFREEGALYLEDLLEDPIKLKVLKPVNTYASLKGKRYLGTLRVGQEVTLVAVSERAYRVRGKAQQGQIVGWAGPAFFKKLAPDFVANLKKAAERKAMVADLIENEQVALGMTGEEVEASLGEPTKRSAKVTAEGKKETLEYITYDKVPQTSWARNAFGFLYKRTTYVKVEKSKLTITLNDDLVSGIEESETNEDRRDRGIIVPTPVHLY
jgi:hypothetical protein